MMIPVCVSLLEYNGTPSFADTIRHLASRILGLAQDDLVANMPNHAECGRNPEAHWKCRPRARGQQEPPQLPLFA